MTEILEIPPVGAWTVDWTCGGCGARLRSSGPDVSIGEFGAMGDYTRKFYVDCPRCHNCKTWTLNTSELPAHVRHAAHERSRS